jgi:hypothetical protein
VDSSQVQPLRLGSRLEGFEVSRITDHDPGGYTYVGNETATKKPVVIREYPSSAAQDLAALAKARHANLAVVLRTLEANNRAFLITEPISGEALSDLLQRENTTFDEARLKSILLPLADGLEAAHVAGVLHLDIQPDHIVVKPNGSPVLVGFGVGKQTRNPGYSAIEQYSAEFRTGLWTDIYALGAVAYRLLSGQVPPEADQRHAKDEMKAAREVGANRYSRSLLQAIDWALKVHPLERPQNLAQWKDALLGLRETGGASGAAGATVPITATMIRKFSELRDKKKGAPPARATKTRIPPTPESEAAKSERAAREKAERERAEHEKLERQTRERFERAERERVEKEKAERERLERERSEKEKSERERAEKEKADRERAEREKAERERVERERIEREKLEREKAERERREREQAEKERREREQLERERADRERSEREKAEREKAERERAEREKVERERAERERVERERAERARAERDRAAATIEIPIVTVPPRVSAKPRPQPPPPSSGPSWISAVGALLVLVLTVGYWWYSDGRQRAGQAEPSPAERVTPSLPPAPSGKSAGDAEERDSQPKRAAASEPEVAPEPEVAAGRDTDRVPEPRGVLPEDRPKAEAQPEPKKEAPVEAKREVPAKPAAEPKKKPPTETSRKPRALEAPAGASAQKQLVSTLRKKLNGVWSQESTYSLIVPGDGCYAKIFRTWSIRFGGTADEGRSLTGTFQTKVRATSAEREECRQFDDQMRVEGAITARPVSASTLQVEAVPTACSGDCDEIADVFNYRSLERRYRIEISPDARRLDFSEGDVDFELTGPRR